MTGESVFAHKFRKKPNTTRCNPDALFRKCNYSKSKQWHVSFLNLNHSKLPWCWSPPLVVYLKINTRRQFVQVNYCKIETLLKIETNIPEKFKQHLQYSLLKKNSLICYQNQKNVDLLAGNMSNLSFDGHGTPGGTGLFPNQNITKRRTRPAGINDSPSPVKPSFFPYEDTSNMDIDEVSQPDMDVSNSPKKLPPKFYERATSNKTQRVVSVCKMYFLEYYCDMFDYVISRRQRTKQVLEYLQQQSQLPNSDQIKLNEEWSSYLQREHQVLRKEGWNQKIGILKWSHK